MLFYSATGSLDGYVAEADRSFDFAHPDEELHLFVNEVFRRAGTIISGRRSYELMDVWDTMDLESGEVPEAQAAFARQWRDADKIVYSRTLERVVHPRTRLEREFDPDAVAALKASSDSDIVIGGAELGGVAFRAGLVDEVWTFLVPTVIGGGAPMFAAGTRLDLELIDQHRFGSGAVGMHYRVRH
ncbi:dihydrofolate reductase family protein [Pseudactinotalea suaedae]|uniref:dihydrofolate reductase family protein n=1 Tax=Pseudactinotalea suaedae TaxID=1524924 RepID=UPI0012E1D1EC|nr:dihydrofolate reductase family protein [Pseudactinotalea suaedae]